MLFMSEKGIMTELTFSFSNIFMSEKAL